MWVNFFLFSRHVVCALVFLTAVQFCLSAEMMVLHRFSTDNPDDQLEDTLYLTAGTELMKAGISSTRTGDGADYLLLTEYSSSDDIVEVAYSLFRLGAPDQEPVEVEFELSLDYDMDTRIAHQVQRLLLRVDIKADPSAEAEIEGLFPDLSAIEPEEAHRAGPDTDTVSEEDAVDGSAIDQGIIEDQKTREKQKTAELQASTPVIFDMSVSIQGLVLFGRVNEYLHYGAAGKFSAGATRRGKNKSLSLGADISFNRVFNDEGVVGGPLYLSTAGASLELGTGSNAPYRIAGGISGGAAFITVAGSNETLIKTVPYGGVGVHALFPLGRGYFLGGELCFQLIFDDDVLIPGASPAFMLSKEF